MAKKTNLELVQHCRDKLGVHYLYAAKGETVTAGKIQQWARQYPSQYSTDKIAKAAQFVGEEATDCSGLISWLTGQKRSSQGYYNTATKRGKISDGIPELPGLAVWHQGHIGIYIGNGEVIEARGINYGVVQTRLKDRNAFTHWLRLCDIEYIEQSAYESPLSTLKKGSRGVRVGWLQEQLNAVAKAGLAVDEEYGSKTESAVFRYQESLGWNATGKAGVKTIVALHEGRKRYE